MNRIALSVLSLFLVSACAAPKAINVNTEEAELVPKQAALAHLRTLPKVTWPEVSIFSASCQYHEAGISDGRMNSPVTFDQWTLVQLQTLNQIRSYLTVTGGENTMTGTNDCYVFAVRPYQPAIHDAFIRKTNTALISLGVKRYTAPETQ